MKLVTCWVALLALALLPGCGARTQLQPPPGAAAALQLSPAAVAAEAAAPTPDAELAEALQALDTWGDEDSTPLGDFANLVVSP